MSLDNLVLGANPLSGVDHVSGARARERALWLDPRSIEKVIKAAFSAGADGFNFGPDPITYSIFTRMKREQYPRSFGLYPILPDIRTLGRAIVTEGSLGVVKELLGRLTWSDRAKAITQSGLSVLTANPTRALNAYLDIEVRNLMEVIPAKAELRTVLAFEMITDMALSLRTVDLVKDYVRHVAETYGIKAGFVTRNFPKFVKFCADCGIPLRDIIIMTPINKLGFQMTPSRELCEETLRRSDDANIIAMSILAGGRISLNEAIDYLRSLHGIKSVCVGVSTELHAAETFQKLQAALFS